MQASDSGYPDTVLISGEVRVYVLRSVMDSHAIGKDGRRYERAEDPCGWLAALPYQYHGTYLWAKAL
jgi:hypothetical protein